jgi:hypothetical protein
MKAVAAGDVVITPAVDCLSRGTAEPSGHRLRHATRRSGYSLINRALSRIRDPGRRGETGSDARSRV